MTSLNSVSVRDRNWPRRAPHIVAWLWISGLTLWGSSSAIRVAAQGVAGSVAPRSTTLYLAGLKQPVAIYRDAYGIPHIFADVPEDAYFALGYTHATDRLFQMELFRRRASGTLAEIFGRPMLADDLFVRQIGIRRSAEATWKSSRLDGRVRNEIEAYWRTKRNRGLLRGRERAPR
jgi:acyl-homoserine lactone acylase PvdQ